ncbi:hypothetical protein [Prevotella pallens]|uniref:hypothetical protein n=1 Tax=Prevotella pallens TaxID=60133 RepID=UPI001CB21A6C|nr:hypothetical protein [Prevotella pallens]MBF1469748.1 hypothetical protein [Prevotella pallens]
MSGCGRDESAPTPDGLFRGCFRSVRHVFCGCFVYFSRCVRCILADRQQCFGNPSAAVGADLSCPHIRKYPRNGERKCVFGEMDMCI